MHKITKRLIYPGLMVYSKVGRTSAASWRYFFMPLCLSICSFCW